MKNLSDARDKAAILARIEKLAPDARARWGKMTAPQMVCHLTDSFRAVLGEKGVSPATGVLQRTLVKWFALYVPVHWPHGVPARPEVDQHGGGTPPAQFATDVQALVAALKRFCATEDPARFHPHPLFGAMSHWEWMRWGYLHVDHHLRQFGK